MSFNPRHGRPGLPHIVIVGAGFGGLNVARGLRKAPVQVTVIDRHNFHLFQPLLYQVATAGLSPADIATPIRQVLRGSPNIESLMAEVTGIDRAAKQVRLAQGMDPVPYDQLVIATGSSHSYFNHPEWAEYAPGLKTVVDATRIRREILTAFEMAEIEKDAGVREAWLRFVIVGGGPTGVELAGSIAELAHVTLAKDFRHIDPTVTEIVVIEAGKKLLAAFPDDLSEKAARELVRKGVKVMTATRVEGIDREGVTLPAHPGGGAPRRLPTRTVIGAAGVAASPAGRWLGVETDRAGRIRVGPDLTLPGSPENFVIGDTCTLLQDGKPLPGVAQVAIQMGKYVARSIQARVPRARGGPGASPD